MELVVATRNQHKLKEIKTLLKGLPLKVVSLDRFKEVPEVIEDCKTLEGNAKKKARETSLFLWYRKAYNTFLITENRRKLSPKAISLKTVVIADDSGLEIDALGSEPGVYSARFSGKGATYKSNNEKVLKLLKGLPMSKRKAQFRCVIAIADKGKVIGLSEGKCRGRIGFEPKGSAGFGYDPIFIPDGYQKTFAQLGIRKKNRISHRSKALIKARNLIKILIEAYPMSKGI